jgi:DNA-binding beta-propeller fold protein YncE
MKTKSLILSLTACAVLISCETSSPDIVTPASSGTLILNNGNWGGNDSSIGVYDPQTKTYVPDAFYAANGQKLGDLGQDMIRYGQETYIAVNGSQTIFITDNDLKITGHINAEADGARLSPRYFTAGADRIYVTYYEGYIGEIDPESHSVRITATGPNPEGICMAGDRLYVAASGGMAYPAYNNTLSIVDVNTFTESGTVTVNVNPAKTAASPDGAYVYVLSFGNYDNLPAMLEVVETTTGRVSSLEYESVSAIAASGDILYILCGGYDENWAPLPGTVYRHDMIRNRPLGAFVADGTTLPEAYSISVAQDGYIYVGCSDYTSTGDVYVFTPEGALHDKLDSQGLNPIKAY